VKTCPFRSVPRVCQKSLTRFRLFSRYFTEGAFDPIAVVAGLIQTAIYADFGYIVRRRGGLLRSSSCSCSLLTFTYTSSPHSVRHKGSSWTKVRAARLKAEVEDALWTRNDGKRKGRMGSCVNIIRKTTCIVTSRGFGTVVTESVARTPPCACRQLSVPPRRERARHGCNLTCAWKRSESRRDKKTFVQVMYTCVDQTESKPRGRFHLGRCAALPRKTPSLIPLDRGEMFVFERGKSRESCAPFPWV
jgi:hypothetical protein